VLVGRCDDLVPDFMIGRTTDARGSDGCLVHAASLRTRNALDNE
jgi:hypothetical protein